MSPPLPAGGISSWALNGNAAARRKAYTWNRDWRCMSFSGPLTVYSLLRGQIAPGFRRRDVAHVLACCLPAGGRRFRPCKRVPARVARAKSALRIRGNVFRRPPVQWVRRDSAEIAPDSPKESWHKDRRQVAIPLARLIIRSCCGAARAPQPVLPARRQHLSFCKQSYIGYRAGFREWLENAA